MVNIWSIISQIIGESCPLCGAPGSGICMACIADLPHNRHACPRCALPLPKAAVAETLCADCQARPPAFDRAIAPMIYRRPVDDLIAGLKYHSRLPLGRDLAKLMATAVAQQQTLPQLLLPIPMHRRGLWRRGFNQAGELARAVSTALEIPWSTGVLRRHGEQGHQRGLRRRHRISNIKGTFSCKTGIPAHVALIDDVITTGATAEEASKALRRAGAIRIEVWAVARTPRERDNGPT